jgi:glycosyltransferase involved in cell wall biosynthesis
MSRVKRLLLVTHRPPHGGGGAAARWRSMTRYLPEMGWTVDVISAGVKANREFSTGKLASRPVASRASFKAGLRRLLSPFFHVFGLQLPPLSTLWAVRGAVKLRRRLRRVPYDAVLATAPPMSALIAARLGTGRAGFVAELRDLWAGNPTYDNGGRLLPSIERWVLRASDRIIVTTPEAFEKVRRQHPEFAGRVNELPNGFEPELLSLRTDGPRTLERPISVIHSGALTGDRPLSPLLSVLGREPYRSAFRLTLHGYVSPEAAAEVAGASCDLEFLPPSNWEDAIRCMAEADVTLITQSREAGDATAVAAKVYEYLALGKPVLCISDGGATERLLSRVGADWYCARLKDPSSIVAALDRLLTEPPAPPVTGERLAPYDRRVLAARMSALLSGREDHCS